MRNEKLICIFNFFDKSRLRKFDHKNDEINSPTQKYAKNQVDIIKNSNIDEIKDLDKINYNNNIHKKNDSLENNQENTTDIDKIISFFDDDNDDDGSKSISKSNNSNKQNEKNSKKEKKENQEEFIYHEKKEELTDNNENKVNDNFNSENVKNVDYDMFNFKTKSDHQNTILDEIFGFGKLEEQDKKDQDLDEDEN